MSLSDSDDQISHPSKSSLSYDIVADTDNDNELKVDIFQLPLYKIFFLTFYQFICFLLQHTQSSPIDFKKLSYYKKSF